MQKKSKPASLKRPNISNDMDENDYDEFEEGPTKKVKHQKSETKKKFDSNLLKLFIFNL